MGSSVSTRSFTTSVNVSEKVHNNLGESTHHIVKTILMQIIMQSSSRDDGTIYVNAPRWDVQRVPGGKNP